MTLGIIAVVVGLAIAWWLVADWRIRRAYQARLDQERAETLRRHTEEELRRRMRDSFSEWPWGPRSDR